MAVSKRDSPVAERYFFPLASDADLSDNPDGGKISETPFRLERIWGPTYEPAFPSR
jgi:hypothetical protein